MIQTVQSLTVNNSKLNSTNYSTKRNVVSKSTNPNQITDTFINSNNNSKQDSIAFKGNVANVTKRFTEEASALVGGAFRKLTGNNELPVAEKPEVLPSYTDDARDRINTYNAGHPGDPVDMPEEDSVASATFREHDRERKEAEEARKAQEAEEARKAQEAEEAKKAEEAEEDSNDTDNSDSLAFTGDSTVDSGDGVLDVITELFGFFGSIFG